MLPDFSQSCTPWADGMRPVRKVARAGEQTGEAQKKLLNRMPSAAIRSRVGVSSSGVPAHPIAHGP